MLVWVEDISATRADLLHASVPWANAEDAFTVASIQKSDKSCLPVREYPDSFITQRNGRHTLQFQHTEDDAERHIRAYVTTLLGSLHCRTDVQLADGKALLLKYVSSYVTKMHESATSEGLYCTDVTGYQATHSFLRTVTPLEPGDGISAVEHQGLLDRQVHSVVQATISGSDRGEQGVQNVPRTSPD